MQYRCRASYHDHNKRVPSLDDVSLAVNNINLPSATSVSTNSYPCSFNCVSPAHARRHLGAWVEFCKLVIQSLIQSCDIVQRHNCLLGPRAMLTPSHHLRRHRQIYRFGVPTLTLPLPVAFFLFSPLSPSNPTSFSHPFSWLGSERRR